MTVYPPRFTSAETTQIMRLVDNGVKDKEIAVLCGVTKSQVQRLRRRVRVDRARERAGGVACGE